MKNQNSKLNKLVYTTLAAVAIGATSYQIGHNIGYESGKLSVNPQTQNVLQIAERIQSDHTLESCELMKSYLEYENPIYPTTRGHHYDRSTKSKVLDLSKKQGLELKI